jgi:hypothetical protein
MCSSCGKTSAYANTIVQLNYSSTTDTDCEYNIDDIDIFLTVLDCVKEKKLLPKTTLNIYYGILNTAKNIPSFICKFKSNLKSIEKTLSAFEECLIPQHREIE